MKFTKSMTSALVILGIVAVVFSVVLFAIAGFEDHSAAFWISYAFAMISFVAAIVTVLIFASKKGEQKDWIYGMPIAVYITIYVAVSLVVSIVFMILADHLDVPFAWPFCILLIVTAAFLILTILGFTAKAKIEGVAAETADKTRFIKLLRADAEMLVSKCSDPDMKKKCEELSEAIRYSDPVSNEILFELEKEVALAVSDCDRAVSYGNYARAAEFCDKAMKLLEERNRKTKALK